jgi:ribonuclease HI
MGALVLYTDGGCRGNRNVQDMTGDANPAGWGVVVLEVGDGAGVDRLTMREELWGPVVVNRSDRYSLGAEVRSNNTGELSAMAEALLWLKEAELGMAPALLCYDSEYAAKITQGIFKAHKNVILAGRCQQLFRAESTRRVGGVAFAHVKGHSGDKWNDRADELVQRGVTGTTCSVGRYAKSPDGNVVQKRPRSPRSETEAGHVQSPKRKKQTVSCEEIDLTASP